MSTQPLAPDLSKVVIPLLKGVLYRDSDAPLWETLLELQARIRDYVAVLDLELMLDAAEGYAFLRSRPQSEEQGPSAEGSLRRPRLVARRPLSFPVSLLLALLRKKLAEFDAGGGDTRLILAHADIVDLIRVFLPDASNEARLLDQIDAHLNKIVQLGFVRRLHAQEGQYEVQRILKAFVDANSSIVAALAERHGLSPMSRHSRTLPANRRYLPPPKRGVDSKMLDARMRREVVLELRKP